MDPSDDDTRDVPSIPLQQQLSTTTERRPNKILAIGWNNKVKLFLVSTSFYVVVKITENLSSLINI